MILGKKKNYPLLILLFSQLISNAQEFSNKGKDFWVGYGLHCRMFSGGNGGSQDMVLYFATEAETNIKVEIPALGYLREYNAIPANTIFTTEALPKTGPEDARLITEGISAQGIHITSDQPIVAYAHIFSGNVSGATLLFPTNTLGKEYYSINFEQHSNESNSNCFFYVIATDTGTTTIEITPAANTQTMNGGQTYTYNLKQGEVFNALGEILGNNGVDLTGSKIKSINTGATGCKPIAVFSGSGKLNIICPLSNSGASADNYMVQSFPKSAWGKRYLTVPTDILPNNFFRICVSDPTTIVKLNGVQLNGLINNFYYQVSQTSDPSYIEADKPVNVAQYITSANQCGNGSPGDPEVIYLSSLEQNLNKVILNSTQNFNILKHFVNVIIPTNGASSFTIDGNNREDAFVPHPGLNGYSYAQISVDQGQHILYSDSVFNAIAYGYGDAESYGYNAGATVKDLYQHINIKNKLAQIDYPATCVGTPFYFYLTIPYEPTSMKWNFHGYFPDLDIPNPKYESSYTLNDKKLYVYKISDTYSYPAIGTYPVTVLASNPTSEGCGGLNEINYNVEVNKKPVVDWTTNHSGCISDTVRLIDITNSNERPIISWTWTFGDNTTDNRQNPKKLYSSTGKFNVNLAVITDIGCIADTTKPININPSPIAEYNVSLPGCLGTPITFTDNSTVQSGTIIKWYWDYGNGQKDTLLGNTPKSILYNTTGSYSTQLTVEANGGCRNNISKNITINAQPQAAFILPEVCLSDAFALFTDSSYISDNTNAAFTYLWNFGDPSADISNPNISTLQNPKHKYLAVGNYPVTLTVTSNGNCVSTITKQLTVNGDKPVARLEVLNENNLCSNTSVEIKNKSTVNFGSINKTEIYWDWLNNPTIKDSDDDPVMDKIYSHQYTNFQFPISKPFSIRFLAYSGGICVDDTIIIVNIHASPKTQFSAMTGICLGAPPHQITEAVDLSALPGSYTFSGPGVDATGLFNPNQTGIGSYTIKYLYVSNFGCKDSASQIKIVWPKPEANFGFLSPNCEQKTTTFSDSSKPNIGNLVKWNWQFGDGISQSNNNANPFNHIYKTTGNFIIQLQVTTDSGCLSDPIQKNINIYPLPQVDFTIPTVCLPRGAAQFTDNSTIADNSQSQFSYVWNFGDPLNINNNISTQKNPVYNYSSVNAYNVSLMVTSKDGCSQTATKTLTDINVQPKADFNINPPFACLGDAVTFNDQSNSFTQGISNWYWQFGDNSGGSAKIVSHIYAQPGSYNASLYIKTNKGCYSDTVVKQLTIYPYPEVNAGPDLFVLEGGQVQIKATVNNASGYKYSWSPAQWLSDITLQQPITKPLNDITYSLKVVADGGCSSVDEVVVKLLKAPIIPNAFSPNKDGINDTWIIKYLESYPDASIQVFDRYGQQVYNSIGYNTPWNGTYKGKELPVGVYYYIVDPKNGRNPITGSVTILK